MHKVKKPNSRSRLRKETLSLYLDPPTAEALRALSARTRIAQQVYLREAIDALLEKYGKRGKS
jgi:predicted DNA-binding protein